MKKHLLFIPLHYNITPRPHEDWFNALNKEFECEYFKNNMGEHDYFFQYIFVQSGALSRNILLSLKYATNAKVIQWTGDARAEVMGNVLQYKRAADLTLLSVGIGQKEMYEQALGSPVGYLQQGVFESFFIEPKELTEGKIVFIGNNYDQFEGAIERAELCAMLSGECKQFEVIGNGWNERFVIKDRQIKGVACVGNYNNSRSIPYEQSARIYNESYISISHACFNDIEGYYSNRTIDIMASGGCCLMRYTPNAEKYFRHGVDVWFYKTNNECLQAIHMLTLNPKLRNEIARNGHETAKKFHTFSARAKELKQILDTCEF
jgi:spore maturation protein CgeB